MSRVQLLLLLTVLLGGASADAEQLHNVATEQSSWPRYVWADQSFAYRMPCDSKSISHKSGHKMADVEDALCLFHGYTYGISVMSNGPTYDALLEEYRYHFGVGNLHMDDRAGHRSAWATENGGIVEQIVDLTPGKILLLEVVQVQPKGPVSGRHAELMANARQFQNAVELPQ